MLKIKNRIKWFSLITCGSLFLAPFALQSATVNWDVDANGNWTDNANWNPNAPTASDDAVMNATLTAERTVTLPSNATTTINDLTFNSTFGYVLAGTTSTLDVDGTLTVSQDPTGSNDIQVNVASPLTVTASTDGLTISGNIVGSGSLTKQGAGTLLLTGDNEYTGQTILSAGTLQIGSAIPLGSTSSIVFNGGTLNATGTTTISHTVTMTGNGTIEIDQGQVVTIDSNFGSGTGTLTLKGGTLVLTGNNSNFTGDIALIPGGTTIVIPAILMASSSSNLGTGDITLRSGTLQATDSFSTSRAVGLNGTNTLTVNSGKTLTLSGVVADSTNAGTLTKLGGGTLILSGVNTYTGGTSLSEGILQVTGSLSATGLVSIGADGTLKGTGTVGAVQSAGTVAPGNSIGTLRITGDYEQLEDAVLEIEINNAGQTDVLAITGEAALDGTLSVLADTGVYTAGTTYTFMTQGTRVGTFATFSQSQSSLLQLIYNATTVQLQVLNSVVVPPIATANLKGNARRVADYLFANNYVATGDLLNAMNVLINLPTNLYELALIKISPVIYGALPRVNLQTDFRMASTFTKSFKRTCGLKRTENRRKRFYSKNAHRTIKETNAKTYNKNPTVSLWAEPIFYYYNQSSTLGELTNEGQPSFTSYTYGTNVAWNGMLDAHWALGFGLGYTHSSIYWEQGLGSGRWNTLYLAPSFGWLGENAFANYIFMTGINFYDLKRTIHYGTLKRHAHNNHNSYDLLNQIEGGLHLQPKYSKYSFEPYANLGVLTIISDGFTETNAESLNLQVRKKHIVYLEYELQLKFLREFYFSRVCFSPGIYIGWLAEIQLTNSKWTAEFSEQSTNRRTFHVLTYRKMINQMVVGCDFPIQNFETFSFRFGYEAAVFSHFEIQQFTAKFNWDF